ncbi:MAG: hypothetical protein COA70_04970 [Planctomycetota bacterium]|nr:MAG: hypothetical protein COA70_04970 [Planctomycetota bacterium]
MKIRSLAFLPLLLVAACSSEPVRLYQLRDADSGTEEQASYLRLQGAVNLANEFLSNSPYARGFPAEEAHFSMGLSDLLLHLKGEDTISMRIETTGWADMRTAFGDGVHPTGQGFLTARRTNADATGNSTSDAAFLQLSIADMAALLLRQAATLREVQERGEFDFWINYNLLGLNPQTGWLESNVVERRAYAVQAGFYQWMDQRNMTAVGEGTVTSEGEAMEETPLVLPAVTPPGGGNFPEPDFP